MLLSCKVCPWGAAYRGFAVAQQSIEIAESQSENFLFVSSIFRFLPPFVARLNFYEAIFFTSEHEFSWQKRDVCKFSIASLNSRYMAES